MTETLTQANARRWKECKINPGRDAVFTSVSARLSAPEAKARYKKVEAKTGVPWWFIAVVHEREASQKWSTQLGQGDPLNKVSVHVPKGRGPFSTWEEGAIDALVNCAPYASRNKDWSPAGALTMLEKYNGLGYCNRGIPSPYVWAGTNQYIKGKYVADGVFDPDAVDKQLGCAGLLIKMKAFSASGAGPATAVIVAGGAATAAAANSSWDWSTIALMGGGVLAAALAAWALVRWYQHTPTLEEKKTNVTIVE